MEFVPQQLLHRIYYRQMNGTPTSAAMASKALGRLRNLGLLSMKGGGIGTYYILGPKIVEIMATSDESLTPYISSLSGGLTPHISSLSEGLTSKKGSLFKGLDVIPKGFPVLSNELMGQIISLGDRSKSIEIKDLIKKLCSRGSLQLTQLAQILDRDPKYLRDYYLSKMVKSGELIYQYPDQPAHPQQAYKVPREHRI